MTSATLLIDAPLSGPANMGRDEALLEACAAGDARPVLRLYRWAEPTISLGYFQDFDEYRKLEPPLCDLPVVRRTTGGGAILHDLEITYALAVSAHSDLAAGGPQALYRVAHAAIVRAIGGGARLFGDGVGSCGSSQRGPFFCFARRHNLDIVVPGGGKIAGSAQRRTKTAILQHGSIILATRFAQQPVACWSALDASVDADKAIKRLTVEFEGALGMPLVPGEWTEALVRRAKLHEGRYASRDWTVNRQRPPAQ